MARIAVPLADDFEDSEFSVPFDRFTNAGHEVVIVGSKAGEQVIGKNRQAKATIDVAAGDAEPEKFDAMVIPGGYSPDHLRLDEDVVAFVREFAETERPLAAICHAPQLLIEADLVEGRTLTSWPSVRKDIENAGGKWVDRDVVEDGSLITSRKPADLDAFCAAIEKKLAAEHPSERDAGTSPPSAG